MIVADTTTEFGLTQGSPSARGVLAVANAIMAMLVGTLTFGVGVGIAAALVLGLLPLTPYLPKAMRAVFVWVQENPVCVCLGLFLLCWIVGSIIWGPMFAFAVALPLAPAMLAMLVWITIG